ncbi:MliC family protein [Nitrospira sp. T9]|uniref:MliC family protein n=1 Tax=unclassified Nitrospira TaxID=2652172 RepID=UPI003F99E718
MAIFLCFAAAFAQTIGSLALGLATRTLCSDLWYRVIEENVATIDKQGHGPDIGSDEWKSVIEFKLGIRDKPDVPSRDTEAWCRHIDQMVLENRTSSKGVGDPGGTAKAQGPSYACINVIGGSIEAMICKDEELSALDRKLSGVYATASKKAINEHPPVLRTEQRGWIKGRDDCWKIEDTRGCVRDEYTRRIAELQARYRLVPHSGPVSFLCEDTSANEVVATFFRTKPPTLIAERGGSLSLMFLQGSGSGAKYQGRNETFWEHQGEALITWGHGSPAMHCKKAS